MVSVVITHVSQADVHLLELRVRVQTTTRRRINSGGWFGDIQASIGNISSEV